MTFVEKGFPNNATKFGLEKQAKLAVYKNINL